MCRKTGYVTMAFSVDRLWDAWLRKRTGTFISKCFSVNFLFYLYTTLSFFSWHACFLKIDLCGLIKHNYTLIRHRFLIIFKTWNGFKVKEIKNKHKNNTMLCLLCQWYHWYLPPKKVWWYNMLFFYRKKTLIVLLSEDN